MCGGGWASLVSFFGGSLRSSGGVTGLTGDSCVGLEAWESGGGEDLGPWALCSGGAGGGAAGGGALGRLTLGVGIGRTYCKGGEYS